MSDFLGTDIKLDDDTLDIVIENGDLVFISGASVVAQDVRIAISKSKLVDCLGSDEIDKKDVKNILEDILLEDPRIDPESIVVTVTENYNGVDKYLKCKSSFQCVGEDNIFNLVFLMDNKITWELLNG